MHVVFVNSRADFAGGAERYIADTTTLLRERGVRCTLLYGVPGWMEPSFTKLFDAAFPIVVPKRQIVELAPDLVYAHQLPDRNTLRELASGVTAPVIRFFHDHAPFCPREHKYTTIRHETCTRTVGPACYPCLGIVNRSDAFPKFRLRTVSMVRAEQEENRQLSAFVVGSTYMKAHVAAHGFEESRIHVIPPFVDEPPKQASVPRDPSLLLFVGALLRGKGLDVLLRAMPYVPRPARLRVIGTGHQEDLFRNMVAELGLADRVQFIGKPAREALHQNYREAACLIIPSRAPETFALVGPEALLHETPVIASRVGGIGEWLEDGVTGLSFPSGDHEALARAIRQVLDDPAMAEQLARTGQRRVRARFQSQLHIDALMHLFSRVSNA